MQGLQPLIAFADTARHGGFAAAARETGVAPSTLAKSVARLEQSLGVKLFHRTTRQVRLTPDGERLYERCERVLLELAELQAEASGAAAHPAGLLRIDMPVYYGRHYVMPVLARLQARYPQLVLDLRLSDGFTDLVRDRIDLAVRIARLSDSTLVARRVGWQHLVLCASADYLARRGTPRRLEDLSGHDAIVFRLPNTGRDRPWQFRQRGADVDIQARPRARISETNGLLEALLLGFGICQVPDYLVAGPISRGRLVELLPSFKPPPLPINIVHPSGRLLPSRVRAAIEALETLRARRES
jgi:LysR family transcriptional regulator for bpeEF and oprC